MAGGIESPGGRAHERVRVRHVAEYALLRFALFGLARLPLAWALWLGRRLGDFTFDVVRLRRRVTLENLRLALGETHDARARQRIARGAYRNIGMTLCELMRFTRARPDELRERTRLVRPEALQEAAAPGRGIIHLTAHTGNWEWYATYLGLLDGPLATIVTDQHNPLVDRFVKATRTRMRGMVLIPVGSALRGVLRTLEAGGRVAIAGDQDAGRHGLFMPFFGHPASAAVGPARFAYRTGSPIIVGFDRHVGGGRHEITLHPPIFIDPARSEAEETQRVITLYAGMFEDFVRRYPDQWLWMHRRWKTRPPGEGSAEARKDAP
jgi:Kdo2-lipid IVA lauroyltransferase/acyltransferase